jgi:hypothetical protein
MLEAVWRHVGDGDGTFDGDFTVTMVSVSVEVPYAMPEDALRLRGGEGLSRTVEVRAVDTNRALGSATWEVAIDNRPPVPVGGAFDTDVPHVFDRERSRYVATLRAGTWTDPDGDPLVDAFGPGPCGTIRMDGNDATLECAVAFEGVPALDQLVGTRSVTVPVRDPWDAATVVPVRTVTIQNSPPSLATTSAPATVGSLRHSNEPLFGSVFSSSILDTCFWDTDVAAVTFDVTPTASDPDGDPILLTATPASSGSASPQAAVLTGSDVIQFHFSDPFHVIQCPSPWTPVSFLVASDGAATTRVGVSPRY